MSLQRSTTHESNLAPARVAFEGYEERQTSLHFAVTPQPARHERNAPHWAVFAHVVPSAQQ